jgi:hypothetical protein
MKTVVVLKPGDTVEVHTIALVLLHGHTFSSCPHEGKRFERPTMELREIT